MLNDEINVENENKNSDGIVQLQVDAEDDVTMSLVVIGCVTGFFLILILCVIVMLIKNRRKPRRSMDLFLFDGQDDNSTCKSAPISRKTSPKVEKRRSCPNAYGTIQGAVLHSPTLDNPPQIKLTTPERIQPMSHEEKSKSTSELEYQKLTQTEFHRSECNLPPADDKYPLVPSAQGRVWFTVMYDSVAQQLIVTLIRLKELPGRNSEEETRDPFVKVYLLPDENVCRTSKVVRKSLNPVYSENFMFQVSEDDINNRSIRFSVYDVDRRRLRHSLGHVVVPLRHVDRMSSAVFWRDLEPVLQNVSSAGEINIGLTYLPQMEKMKVIILRARNVNIKFNADTGLLVRLQFSYGNKVVKSKQTLTQRAGQETNFNESFSFSTSAKNIDNFNFNVTLVQTSRGSMTDDVSIGHVNLGSFMHARGAGLLHWQEMLAKTRSIVSKWHPLNVQL